MKRLKLGLLIFIVYSTFLLAACVGASAGDIRPLSVQEAGRIVIDATNTAQVMATQNTLATATRQVVINLTADARSQTEWEAKQREEQKKRDEETQKRLLAQQQLSDNATKIANQNRRDDTAAIQNMIDAREWGETQRTTITAFVIVGTLVSVVIVIASFIGVRMWIEVERERRRQLHEVEVMQKKLIALSMAIRETRAGTVMPMIDGAPLVINQLAGPSQTAKTPEEMQAMLSDAPDAPEVKEDPLVINADYSSYTIPRVTSEEEAARQEMIAWIDSSIEWHARNGSKAAHRETFLKSWRELGKEWNSDRQKRARSYFGDELIAQSGVGTWATEGRSLLDLKRDVKMGKIKIALPHSQGQAVKLEVVHGTS